jgi:hypothetical protein
LPENPLLSRLFIAKKAAAFRNIKSKNLPLSVGGFYADARKKL